MDLYLVTLLLLSVGRATGDCLCYESDSKTGLIYQCSNIKRPVLPKVKRCKGKISEIAVSDSNMGKITNKTFRNLNITFVSKILLIRCNIKDIQIDTFSEFGMELQSLDLSNNSITENTLSRINLLRLQVLRLKDNPLQTIHANTFHPNLRKTISNLNLDNCSIDSIESYALKNLSKLCFLSLSKNRIKNIDFLRHCHSSKRNFLSALDISFNLVESTSVFTSLSENSCFANLARLHIGGNPLQFQDGELFSSATLNYLDIQFLQEETAFPLLDMPRLNTLIVKGTRLKNIRMDSFEKATNLSTIDMSGSNISYLSLSEVQKLFKPLQNVQELNLQNTSIRGNAGQTFRSFTTLTYLNLGLNEITKIAGAFSTLSKLKHLQVYHNNISVITLQDLPANPLLKFDFSGNPFHCTCAIADFRIYCGQNMKQVESQERYFCKSPKEYAEKRFWSFQPKYSDCHGFNPYIITAIVICVFVVILVLVLSFLSTNRHRIQSYFRVRKLRTGYTQISGSSTLQVS